VNVFNSEFFTYCVYSQGGYYIQFPTFTLSQFSFVNIWTTSEPGAVNDNIRRQAIGSMGSNFGQASLANKKGEMDQSMMDMLPKMMNNPEFQKFYEEWSKKNA
jgi:hypothetical protein